jgi:hypothetical protein
VLALGWYPATPLGKLKNEPNYGLTPFSFWSTLVHVPRYLVNDARYHGGADNQYNIKDEDEEHAVAEGWVARRWDPAVQERLHKLFLALGKEFDGKVEGINVAETAVSFGESGRLFPKGFTPAIYRQKIDGYVLMRKGRFSAFALWATDGQASFSLAANY